MLFNVDMPELQSEEVAAAFEKIPLLSAYDPSDFIITSLPGYTNLNFRLFNDQLDWVLRIPREETSGFVNRSHEQFNRSIAASLGLTSDSLWVDQSGLSLTATLSNTKTLLPEQLHQEQLLHQLAIQIRKLHSSETPFKGRLDIGETIHRYYDLLRADQRKPLAARMAKAEAAMSFFKNQNLTVPTHSDLNENNILIESSHRLWFIDWEYSAMASPYWDLAIVCHYCRLSDVQRQSFFESYCGEDRTLVECELVNFIGLIALLTDCWMTALAD